ncbi:MAG: PfkB family carbohydrate kinase [bacterium]|nr:PfkB family carbohydrate kinase [bacterium]
MSLLVVGSVALDSVKTPFAEASDVLGGAAVYFSTAASIFTQVKLVGVIGSDFPKEHMEYLKNRGIDIKGLKTEEGKTFRWSGSYSQSFNEANTLDTQLNVFASFNPTLPQDYKDAKCVFLANIDPALQLNVLQQVESPKIIALDTMNYWIDNKKEALLKTIKEVDIMIINDAEAKQLSGEHNINKAMEKIISWGLKCIIVKRGEYGSVTIHSEGYFSLPAYPLREVIDPTGAGDTFAGGFMGYLASVEDIGFNRIKEAMAYGTALASFNVEDFSLGRLKTVRKEEVIERVERLREMMRF